MLFIIIIQTCGDFSHPLTFPQASFSIKKNGNYKPLKTLYWEENQNQLNFLLVLLVYINILGKDILETIATFMRNSILRKRK